jgi:hypothetical protein
MDRTGGCAASPAAAQLIEQALDTLLRRFEQAPLEFGVERSVVFALADLDPEHEAARLDDRSEVLEARLLPADLPSSDLGTITTEALGELGLREPGSEPCLADELGAGDARILRSCCARLA